MWYIKKLEDMSAIRLHNIMYHRSKIFVVEQGSAFQDADDIDLDAWHVYKMNESEELQAYIRVYVRENGVVGFGRVLVPIDQRGEGFGRDLVAKALEVAQDKYPGKPVRIEAEQYLEKFYGSFGFKTISEPYVDYGIWHVDMELEAF